jgi:hypothetical protein
MIKAVIQKMIGSLNGHALYHQIASFVSHHKAKFGNGKKIILLYFFC